MNEFKTYNLLNQLSLYIYNREIHLSPGFGYTEEGQDEYVYTTNPLIDEEQLHMLKVYVERDRFYSRGSFRDHISTTFRIAYEDYFMVFAVNAKRKYKYKSLYDTNNLETEDIVFDLLLAINDYETDRNLFRYWDLFSMHDNKETAFCKNIALNTSPSLSLLFTPQIHRRGQSSPFLFCFAFKSKTRISIKASII